MSEEFRGLIYAPSYEDEVIMLFGMILQNLEDRFEIEEYTDEFPDCSAKMNGKPIGIELELANKSWVCPSQEIETGLRQRFNRPKGYYKNYHVRDRVILSGIEEALE